ncbi:GDP-mannose 4,6-dehydratase [Leptolinea tardivitalis]|uniref:GDP-mannose 4,6-dehydratase n=1 Tax=Leptolinea tardivitalis TaxID=229920 RepID=UPI0007804EBA|nr:GDP-mannose 4,6-dehydratase [Leptolinea tardivitalis]GAP20339.1 dTDP-D-glucose 4,6-dehydratase [Leptolinea tardivitalis]
MKTYLITGGAGFIGSNYVSRLLGRGEKVIVFDNLSRNGSKRNIEWLREQYGREAFELVIEDIRKADRLAEVAHEADVIVHLAAQVAVTTSVTHPREDFEINALGTFNALEAARNSKKKPVFLYASTNKVYGGMEQVKVRETATRYEYENYPLGISEEMPLDFHSPYGCSKGCGDQYVRDYARIYGLKSVVFRQSCIYGTRQFGVEDQGWVAWFVIAAAAGRKMTIYGDGKQVRDLLFVEDLLNAYDLAIANIKTAAGNVYNVGGGSSNVISIWNEFAPILEKHIGHPLNVDRSDWRPGDQRIYVSDIRKAQRELGWSPKISVEEGIQKLYDWVKANIHLFQ